MLYAIMLLFLFNSIVQIYIHVEYSNQKFYVTLGMCLINHD